MLESGKPEDIIDAKELDIKLRKAGSDSEILKVVSINNEDEEDDVLFFTIKNWRGADDEEMCAVTRATGGKIDPDILQNYRAVRFCFVFKLMLMMFLQKRKMVKYVYEEKEGYRRRWWLVTEC